MQKEHAGTTPRRPGPRLREGPRPPCLSWPFLLAAAAQGGSVTASCQLSGLGRHDRFSLLTDTQEATIVTNETEVVIT